MKEKIYNNDKLSIMDINDKVIRVKAIILNSKNEILLGESYNTIQFPGGHLEDNETLQDGLKREIKEETGIILNDDYEPFFVIKHYVKDYPVIGNNRSIEIYYYYIKTDEHYNEKLTNLDDREREGNFKLFYIPFKNTKKILREYLNKNVVNKVITSEMKLALKEFKKKRF